MAETAYIPERDDERAFTEDLARALERRGWEIVRRPDAQGRGLTIRRPSTYRILLRCIHHRPGINRVVIFVIFGGKGSQNLAPESLQALNRLNDEYNLAKLSLDADGDLWVETVYPFGDALDVDHFSRYLEWWDAALTAFAREHLERFAD